MDYSVLTGDIVGSSELGAPRLDETFDRIRGMAHNIAAWSGGPEQAPLFDRHRGDGWQLVVPGRCAGLRAAVLMRAAALSRGVDTRVSVGLGGRGEVVSGRVGAMDGPAFRLSGRGLETMERARRLMVVASPDIPGLSHAVVHLCDAVISRWTDRQAEVLAHILMPAGLTHAEVATMLDVKQPTVTKHVHAAAGRAVGDALDSFERFLGDGAMM